MIDWHLFAEWVKVLVGLVAAWALLALAAFGVYRLVT